MDLPGLKHCLQLILVWAILWSGWVSAAEVETGKQLAMQGNGKGAAPCVGCHGADGGGNAAANFPRLAGLDGDYLAKQLQDFISGTRNNPIMQPIASALSKQEIDDVAAYYASLPLPQRSTQAQAVTSDSGKQLVELGDWNSVVPACIQCHGPGARGVGMHFPALAGQHAGYIESQLQAWRQGTRKNDPNQLMKGVADRLDDSQVKAVSAYLASLPSKAD
ncbi:MAG: c-type cytochrome [Chromatiales bacterium]|jgi:cytochrome c553